MTRRAVCIVSGIFLFVFLGVGFLFYAHNKTIKEITSVESDGIYIRWPIKKHTHLAYYPEFEFATYYLRITPTGIPVEGVIKQNALPFTATTSFTWNLKDLAIAEKCTTVFRYCNKLDESEIRELEVLLREGRRRCKLHTGHEYAFPAINLAKPRSAI